MSAHTAQLAHKRTSQYWLNLITAALILFYLLFIGWKWSQDNLCGSIAGDYCDYWAAGTVANRFGYAQVYDPNFIGPVDRTLAPWYTGDTTHPYLPVFTPAFQVLALFPAPLGYWVWIAFNTAALFLYLRFFAARLKVAPLPPRLVLTAFVSLPFFQNIVLGQIDVWITICVGEFIRAMIEHKPFRAGLWLGGFALKPQALVVLGLVLLVQRSVRVLAGLAASSAALALVSLLMIGPRAFVQMLSSWLMYGNSSSVPWVQGMMNWRMLGYHLSDLATPWLGSAVTVVGMMATLGLLLFTWRQPFDPDSSSFPVAAVGVLAAVTMLAWHSHVHLALFLIPALLYAVQRGLLPRRLWHYWVFVPAVLYMFMVFIPEALMALGILPESATPLIHGIIGAGEFSASMVLFVWAVRKSLQARVAVSSASLAGLAGQ